ncbi:hypothetical protein [Nonomuraea helvata]|uniref:Uncharacterized protein n=1 Tax=Nonomuraea helvata TaxID=37484 RepID=A0ABV5RYM7_9ACTN
MRHILPIAAAILWLANLVYVAAITWMPLAWHESNRLEPVQLLTVGAAVAVTIAWQLHRQGIEYRIGYRHGRADR